jgi:hypothetical protein
MAMPLQLPAFCLFHKLLYNSRRGERFKLGTTCRRKWAVVAAKQLFWLIVRRYRS